MTKKPSLIHKFIGFLPCFILVIRSSCVRVFCVRASWCGAWKQFYQKADADWREYLNQCSPSSFRSLMAAGLPGWAPLILSNALVSLLWWTSLRPTKAGSRKRYALSTLRPSRRGAGKLKLPPFARNYVNSWLRAVMEEYLWAYGAQSQGWRTVKPQPPSPARGEEEGLSYRGTPSSSSLPVDWAISRNLLER